MRLKIDSQEDPIERSYLNYNGPYINQLNVKDGKCSLIVYADPIDREQNPDQDAEIIEIRLDVERLLRLAHDCIEAYRTYQYVQTGNWRA